MYAGVSACGDVQSCLAQCPKYLIGFFPFSPGFGELGKSRPLFPKDQHHVCLLSIYSSDPVLIS